MVFGWIDKTKIQDFVYKVQKHKTVIDILRKMFPDYMLGTI